jgi:Uma2 family endonuclease
MFLEAKKTVSLEAFARRYESAENADFILELISGAVVEMPSNGLSSKIAMRIGRYLGAYVDDHNLGHVTGEAAGYQISEENVYAPDVGYIAKTRLATLPAKSFIPKPPHLAVEVLSPSNTRAEILTKVSNYLAVGTIVWVVDIQHQKIQIHAPNQLVKEIGSGGTLEGGSLLPDFSLAVDIIFKGITFVDETDGHETLNH